jgi:cytochrome c oxidase assembly factor CtaG
MGSAAPTAGRLLGSWAFDPVLTFLLLSSALLYVLGAARARGWPRARSASFAAGLAVLALALLSGLERYATELLSVHVVQHLLLVLVAPALLLWGAPVRLALRAWPAARRTIAATLRSVPMRALTRPAAGFALFACVVLVGAHPTVFQFALRDPFAHVLEHAAYFYAGLLFLAPLVAADPLAHRPQALERFSWVMAGMVAMSVPGALLSFGQGIAYPFYRAPAAAGHRSALEDQHVAGALMWVGGGVAMFALALAIAGQAMLAEERRQQRRELHEARKSSRTKAVLGG